MALVTKSAVRSVQADFNGMPKNLFAVGRIDLSGIKLIKFLLIKRLAATAVKFLYARRRISCGIYARSQLAGSYEPCHKTNAQQY